MPFIGEEREKEIDSGLPLSKVGDLCNVAYRSMVSEYDKEPTWTTIHVIKQQAKNKINYRAILGTYSITRFNAEVQDTAIDLAWDVFCALYVIPHEQFKRNTNGDVGVPK